MFNQFLQLLTLLLTVAGSIVSTIYGYKSVTKNFDNKLEKTVASLHEALRNKVDVVVYAATVKDLYEAKNTLAIKVAEQERELKVLNELLSMFLKKQQ